MMLNLGAYPSDSYYDPNRPAWLPYWVDTPTESALKWGAYPGVTTLKDQLPSPPPPSAPILPSGAETGSVAVNAVDQVLAGTWAQQQSGINQFFSALAAEEEERQQGVESSAWLRTIVIAAAVGFAGLLLLKTTESKR